MSIEVGSKLQGKVTGITNFGAFVELPNGSTGLVHISEVADNYVKDINDHLKVGDMVEVKVMNVGTDGKIGLSIRKAKPEAERPQRPQRPRHSGGRPSHNERPENFEQKMAKFMKDSEERLSTLKRATESKRGGRGARRG
ncbi:MULTISPECIES: S1 domain-containing RNA-binding protein [Sporosarcina]|jgi:S1 RNA binding domain protein|uniref:S1 domain-containing RNA-binding protein n=1 Tax=Bacillales TaxID=1385 RepID=UPI000756C66E|nr:MULTISPECIES: S1 domain-containing RNA-binding protein [Sporosarcina]MCM3745643.1 S1 domain-containing RNA-binding protein [Sporosarcina luteola]